MRINIIPHKFHSIISDESKWVSLFSDTIGELEKKDLVWKIKQLIPMSLECKSHEKNMFKVWNKLCSLNSDPVEYQKNNMDFYFLNLKVWDSSVNFDSKSIINTKDQKLKDELKKDENTWTDYFLAIAIEKTTRKVGTETRQCWYFFMTKKGSESITEIVYTIIKTMIDSQHIYSSWITDKNQLYKLESNLKAIELSWEIDAWYLSSLDWITDEVGRLKVKLEITPAKTGWFTKKLTNILWAWRNSVFDKSSLFKFSVEKIKWVIIDSYWNERKESLINDDNTVEAIEKALTYYVLMEEDNFSIDAFKNKVFAFIDSIQLSNDQSNN